MKRIINILLLFLSAFTVNAQTDTIECNHSDMLGVEVAAPHKFVGEVARGFLNVNYTKPQLIADDYYIMHYMSAGYSFYKRRANEYVLSYGIGIPLHYFQSGTLYGYLIDGYHYRGDYDDFRKRRVKAEYRKKNYGFSIAYTLRHSLIFGYSFNYKKTK